MQKEHLKIIKKSSLKHSAWIPTRPPSKGARAYHDAVLSASWHKENIKGLIEIVRKKIKDGDVLVDFGAGTGSSAIYLLKYLDKRFKLLLVDNSASWLTKAYEILSHNKEVVFFLLEKKGDKYQRLDDVVGKNTLDHVVSANTVHLIPQIKETFQGIYDSLKKHGTFTFQSGNIMQSVKDDGVLTIDYSINEIHDMAIEVIRKDSRFKKYKQELDILIKKQIHQRKFVFPDPRPIEFYLEILKSVGFRNEKVTHKRIKVEYRDWLNFLRVRRLQTGILPEVGGKDASTQEEKDRDTLITKAALQLFKKLKKQNHLANAGFFTAKWTYVHVEK